MSSIINGSIDIIPNPIVFDKILVSNSPKLGLKNCINLATVYVFYMFNPYGDLGIGAKPYIELLIIVYKTI